MNAPLRLTGRGRPVETLTPEQAASFVADGPKRADDIAGVRKAFRTAGWIVGGVGALLGLIGMGGMTYAYVSWERPPPQYIPLDAQMVPRNPIRAGDVVQHFTDATSRFYLRMYLDRCESYHFDTAKLTSAQCLLLMSPPAQEKWAKSFDVANANSPQRRFGQRGSLSVFGQPIYSLVGKGRQNTEVWNVHFTKVEQQGNQMTCVPYLLNIGFQWRPDLPMSDADREHNLAGFQVITFDSQPDTSRRPEC